MRPLGGDTVTLVIPDTVVDTRDNSTHYDFTTPTLVAVAGCNVQPFLIAEKLQEEITVERDFARTTWRVWAPAIPEVLALQPHDRIQFQGDEYEVFGFVGSWRKLSGATHHAQFIIELRQG